MRKYFFLLGIAIILAAVPLKANAQSTEGSDGDVVDDRHKVKAPALAIKWSPLHLIYFYPSVQVAIEHRLFKNLNVQYDLGLIVDYPQSDSEDFSDKHGYRVIGELRYYVPSPPKVPFYVATELYHSKIAFTRSQVVGYGCETGDCDYFQYVDYDIETINRGIGIKFGVLLYPGWNKNRSFFFDINAGGAFRDITYKDIGRPNDGPGEVFYDNDNDRLFAPSEQSRTQIRFVLGVRLGYTFL
jgi:hypothetical protein